MTEHLNGLNKRKLLSSFVAAVLAVGLMVPVAAAYATPSSSSKEAEAQAALDNYKQMQNQLDEASNHYTEALMKQEEAQNKVITLLYESAEYPTTRAETDENA